MAAAMYIPSMPVKESHAALANYTGQIRGAALANYTGQIRMLISQACQSQHTTGTNYTNHSNSVPVVQIVFPMPIFCSRACKHRKSDEAEPHHPILASSAQVKRRPRSVEQALLLLRRFFVRVAGVE